MRLQSFARLTASLLAFAASSSAWAGASEAELWNLLKGGGQVVLMRHAQTTPGIGDPPGMRTDDCSTQRNLTEEGRKHARAIGEAVRAHGVEFDRIISSPMCHCLDTAKLAFGRVDETQVPGNPRATSEDRNRTIREVRAIATEKHRGGNVIVLSHSSTIGAVTELYVDAGEMLVVTPLGEGKFEVRGRLMAAPPPK
jgi:broad specificity phosphatase PhoE